MSYKSFTGTLTVGEEEFAVTASLTRNGIRVLGFLVFTEDDEREVPIQFIISGSAFKTYDNIWFTDPDDRTIKLLPIDVADSSINTTFTQIDITETDITIDGDAGTLSLDLDAVAESSEVVSIESEDEEIEQGSLKSVDAIRINEVGNTLDHYGNLLSTRRLRKESNRSYAKRIRRVMREPGSSNYFGLMNSITRDLGLELSDSISVSIKESPAALAKDLRFVINHKEAIIYTLWIPLEEQEDGFDPVVEQRVSLEGMTIGKLVDWINQSGNYDAKPLGNADREAKFLVNYDSLEVIDEVIPPQEIVKLSKTNLIPGSISITPTEYMNTELNIASNLTTKGQFKVSYANGIIYFHTCPKNRQPATYTINNVSFVLKSSPVRIVDITSESGQDLFFNQIEREFYTTQVDRYVNGLPTNDMYKVMRQILTAGKFNQFWGE